MLLVEHRVDMITPISDRVTVLNVGRVIAVGGTATVVCDPAVTDDRLGEHSVA